MEYIIETSVLPVLATWGQISGIAIMLASILIHKRYMLIMGVMLVFASSLYLSDISMCAGIVVALICLWNVIP